MTDLSDLGTFRLGAAQLGHALGQIQCSDSLSFTDSEPILSVKAALLESISVGELVKILAELELLDSVLVSEGTIEYPTEGWAGVIGRTTLRMDVTWEDFCAMVEESGMSISLNGTPCRGFCFLKQRAQSFEPNIGILPGDAVLFTCPTDETTGFIKAGDIVDFDGATFTVQAVRNKYFDGNIIYRKSLLRKKRVEPDMPAIGNLVASANLEGKTKLTWDAIDLSIFSYFDYYEVHESTDGINYFYRTKTRTPGASIDNLVPNAKYYYKVRAVDKYNHSGDFSAVAETPIDDVPPAPPTGVR